MPSQYLIHVGPVKETFQSRIRCAIAAWDDEVDLTVLIDGSNAIDVEPDSRDAHADETDPDAWEGGVHHTTSQKSESPWASYSGQVTSPHSEQ
jgi:hypothetical protein